MANDLAVHWERDDVGLSGSRAALVEALVGPRLKKSQASIWAACWRTNSRQVVWLRRGDELEIGGKPDRLGNRATGPAGDPRHADPDPLSVTHYVRLAAQDSGNVALRRGPLGASD